MGEARGWGMKAQSTVCAQEIDSLIKISVPVFYIFSLVLVSRQTLSVHPHFGYKSFSNMKRFTPISAVCPFSLLASLVRFCEFSKKLKAPCLTDIRHDAAADRESLQLTLNPPEDPDDPKSATPRLTPCFSILPSSFSTFVFYQ